ncbi:MAG: phosphate/phosphite/phosphonate ABC transporter substrate-binding protein [Minwuiales bacterium]|nr:phosphate/phosphite/phosphonate ABC transporter substrate-binding protein [Minwuiales bacterium]
MRRFLQTNSTPAVRVLAAALCLAFSMTLAARAEAPRDLVFGIVPQQSATRLAQVWVPLLNHLSERTGHTISFATAKDIPTFEACLARGAYDFAYMNPYHYTVFHETAGYRAFARQSKKQLKGIMVARKDSAIGGVADLNGEKVAFPSPAAFGASVLPRAEMSASGIAIEPVYVKSHDSVYRAVAAGIFPAGGGVVRTFNNVDPAVRDQLKIIHQTDEYTPHAFAAHRDVPAATADAVADVLLQAAERAPALLKPLGMKGFEKADDAGWDDVRALNLTRAETQIISGQAAQCRFGSKQS